MNDGTWPHQWCGHCRRIIGAGCICGVPAPMQHWGQIQAPAPKQRSVVGTTLLVLVTIFIIVPFLLVTGCSVMFGIAGLGSL